MFTTSNSREVLTPSTYESWWLKLTDHLSGIYPYQDLEKPQTKEEKKDYLNYWRKINILSTSKTVELSKSFSGQYNKNIIPEEVFALNFESYLVPRKEVSFLENKSFYEKWFGTGVFPATYFNKIDNVYYDAEFKVINNIYKYIEECNMFFPAVFKPSVDSYGGANVFFIKDRKELIDLLDNFTDIVCQEKIIQSQLINEIYNDSINTVRVCLYKSKGKNFKVINSSLRMGKDGGLDNETAGGIVCSIDDSGVFNNYGIDKFGIKYSEHPNSNYKFSEKILPFYTEMIEASEKVANEIFLTRLVSLDMCLDSNDKWKCIEVNLSGQTIRFAQYAGKPFFGEFTDSLYDEIVSAKNAR